MLDKILLSSDRKLATCYYTDRHAITLSHSEGRVEELVTEFFILPARMIEAGNEVTNVIQLFPVSDTTEEYKEAA